ncbi:hypothetical protein MMC26_001171 [Xylographa opegraphella]|nr:hypothetical protein [Xylographa opegraphella]
MAPPLGAQCGSSSTPKENFKDAVSERPALEVISLDSALLADTWTKMASDKMEGREVILDLVNRQKRRAKGPFRRFTVLTARALATFLASENDAMQRLCPHSPAVDSDPEDCAFPTDRLSDSPLMSEVFAVHGQHIYDRLLVSDINQSPGDASILVSNETKTLATFTSATGEIQAYPTIETSSHQGASSVKRRPGSEKDPKSFTQNLYDTEIFKASGIVEIRNGSYRVSLPDDLGQTGVRRSEWRSHTNQQFRKVVDSELLTHPLLTTAWEDIGVVFLSERNIRHNPDAEYMKDSMAAQVVMKAFSTLTCHLPLVPQKLKATSWELFVSLRKVGQFVPTGTFDQRLLEPVLQLMDSYDDEIASRLMVRLTRAFASRRCWSLASAYSFGESEDTLSRNIKFPVFVNHIVNGIRAEMNQGEKLRVAGTASDSVLYQEDLEKTWDTNLGCSTWKVGPVRYVSTILEWLRSVIIHEWDGKAEFHRFSAVGGAVDLMACFYERRIDLGLSLEVFSTPIISDRLDPMEMPVNWLSFKSSRNTLHLLSFPFLFTPATLVTYFRSVNYAVMAKAYESTWATFNLYQRLSHFTRDVRVQGRLKAATNSYLVLDIRRHSLLSDALDQLWRRQKRELMRPLKVRMGMDEGEEGVDHGGVQQEFFRIALGQALNPDYGLFTTDARTRMSWFKPCSLEHFFKFELLGLLTSLAIYNGVTLPVTFPLAFYRKLLGMPVTNLSHIQDGWPELAKGLQELLSWSDGDVADVFMRSYIFAVEIPGGVINVDMEREGRESGWPGGFVEENKVKLINDRRDSVAAQRKVHSTQNAFEDSTHTSNDGSNSWVNLDETEPSLSDAEYVDVRPVQGFNTDNLARLLASDRATAEANMVTNENREQYVADYIYWLTEKSIQPQYDAFARGFFVCLDKKALSIFTPEALQKVVEGDQTIDLAELESATKYENGYSADHPTIKDFWFVVRSFSEDQLRKLLEFVTASDRVPVKGVSSMTFMIQRNGTDDDRLPTSLTCFGRLLLPEYSSRDKLQEKLCLAIENAQGFGVP